MENRIKRSNLYLTEVLEVEEKENIAKEIVEEEIMRNFQSNRNNNLNT